MKLVLILFVFCCCGLHTASSAPDVSLSRGILRGVDENALGTQRPCHVYYTIPFAEPPLGGLRFKPPQPFFARDASQVINSDRMSKICIQDLSQRNTVEQSEDCLYLNVYTPSVGANGVFDSNAGRKVMVWIHGGAYSIGGAFYYRPTRLVTDHDVIVVTIQYRLGVFGFLSSGDDVLPGNLGLRDQILALQWVKDSIRQFGGDPNDVTIFGESAGAGSASVLALSPLTKGLFTKVILQSGTAVSPWAVTSNPSEAFYKVAKNAKCLPAFYLPFTSSLRESYNQQIVNCLSRLSSRDLHNLMSVGFTQSVESVLDFSKFIPLGPVVDGDLLPRKPATLLADVDYLDRIGAFDRKYLIGFNNNELLGSAPVLLPNADVRERLTDVDDSLTQDIFRQTVEGTSLLPVTDQILNYVTLTYMYPRDWRQRVPLQHPINLANDINFMLPAIQLSRGLVKASSAVDVYFYFFDHYPQLKDANSPLQGSSHGLEIAYIFDDHPEIADFIYMYQNPYDQSSLPLIELFQESFANLAKTGNPSTPGNPRWLPYDLQNESFMALKPSPELRQRPFPRRVSLWTDFLPQARRGGSF